MLVGDKSLHDKTSARSPVESIREELIDGETVVCMVAVAFFDVIGSVEVSAENKAIQLSDIASGEKKYAYIM
jgi:hypothetical protein